MGGAAIEAVGGGVGGGPKIGEVARGDGEAQAVPFGDNPAGGGDGDGEGIDFAGCHGFGMGEGRAAGGVEGAIGDEGGGAVWGDVGELGDEVGDGGGGGGVEGETWPAEEVSFLGEGVGGVDDGEGFVGTLVIGEVVADAAGGPESVVNAGSGAVGEFIEAGGGRGGREVVVGGEVEGEFGGSRRGEGGVVAPGAGDQLDAAIRGERLLHVDGDGGLAQDAGVFVAEEVGKEARGFVDPIDAGTGEGGVGLLVNPGSDEEFLRSLEIDVGAEHGMDVAVVPAGDEEGGNLEAIVVGAERAVAPIGGVDGVLEPLKEIRLVVFKALLPEISPAGAGEFRLRGQGVHGNHGVAVGASIVVHAEVAATIVVAVVGVTVVGGVERDDGFEGRGAVGGDLNGSEAGVGNAVHADVAVRPRLAGEPLDSVDAIELLDETVFVGIDALRGAGAAGVEANRGETAFGEIEVLAGGAATDVVFAVGLIHDDDGEAPRRVGAEDVGGEAGTVAGGDHDGALGFDGEAGGEGDGGGKEDGGEEGRKKAAHGEQWYATGGQLRQEGGQG